MIGARCSQPGFRPQVKQKKRCQKAKTWKISRRYPGIEGQGKRRNKCVPDRSVE